MKKTALVILAAGIGSRFGTGIKQMTPLGPNGEIMLDYSIHDALRAGFDKVVFIIRKDLDHDFRELIGSRIEQAAEVAYAYQELTDLPDGFELPEGRTKPWGTGQALLAARDVIQEPFVVINADDYYGRKGFEMLHRILTEEEPPRDGRQAVTLAAFVLGNTLSENGGVTRGILDVSEDGHLNGLTETRNIVRTPDGAGIKTENGIEPLDPESLVSMNMWGLHPGFIKELEKRFPDFLRDTEGDPMKKEYLLPEIIDRMLREGSADVRTVRTDDIWFGVTYHEDIAAVQDSLAALVKKGVYRSPLFPS